VGLYFLQEYFLDKTYEYLVEWNRSAVNDANHWYRRPGMSDLYNRYESFYNFNIQLSGFVTNADAFTSYRDNHSRLKNPRVKMTDESVGSLLLSPVKWRHLSNPWVYVPIGVFALGSWFGMDKLANSDKIDRITVIDKQYPRTDALVRSSSIAFVKYGLVAIQEEMMYRGILQTELTELTNPTAGIILSSAIFSTMHLFHNDVSTAVGAFLGGLYMGYRYYASGYDLGEPIAFHFYANFITTCISAIRNPKEGMYVYAISWKF
jgi:membrane protease YdiL (CAAX protease family)